MKYTTIKNPSGLYSILDDHGKCVIMSSRKALLPLLSYLKNTKTEITDNEKDRD